MRDNGDFIKQLRDEIGETQKRRATFVQAKLAFVSALLGAGAISIKEPFETGVLLYLIPLVSFVFDLYILGEDFSIKRAAVFIKTSPSAPREERLWEEGVDTKRDWFRYWAAPLSSAITLLAASVGVNALKQDFLPFIPWFIICVFFIVVLAAYSPIRKSILIKFEENLKKQKRGKDYFNS